VPSNEQRRDAAKRKLERQLERRAQAARRRKRLTIVGGVVAAAVVVGGGIGIYAWQSGDSGTASAQASPTSTDAASQLDTSVGKLPPVKAKPATVSCAYAKAGTDAGKPVPLPHTTGVKTVGDAAHVSISMVTNQGNIGMILNTAQAPCAVNSFADLVGHGWFDHTPCHRLTTEGIKVLQCGDPTGRGDGGPGYQFADEYPTDQYPPRSPELDKQVNYPRGTIAMANSGPNTNGSQFFLVYGDSPLQPKYTVIGTVDATGLATLDKIAAAGEDDRNGPGDGAPTKPVTITSMQLD
jgi:peptidyl-prolyl cis-trans isomerase B (cyclophilin B)